MSLFGALFGDAKDADVSQAPNQLAAISTQLFNESTPLRQGLIDRYSTFLNGGGLSPTEQQELSTLKGLSQEPSGSVSVLQRFMDKYNQGGYNSIGQTGEAQPSYSGVMPIDLVNRIKTGGSTEDNLRLLSQLDPSLASSVSPSGFTDAQRARMSFLEGRVNTPGNAGDVTSLPQFASLKDAIQKQFSRAKDNVLATTANGGALTSALSNLEGTKASATVSGISDLQDKELARAFALATGQTPVALSGLGSAAGSLSNIAAAQSVQQGQALQGIGIGIGSSIGRKSASSGGKNSSTTAT